MSSKSQLIQQLRAAVPVATLSECVDALKEARNDLDEAVGLLAEAQEEANADKRDRLEALSSQGLLFQLLSLVEDDPGGSWEAHEGWLDDLKRRTCELCLTDILSDRFKNEPWALYRRVEEFSTAAQRFDVGVPVDKETEDRLGQIRRRTATQLLMAMIAEHAGTSEATGRILFHDGDSVTQIRIFPDPQETPPSAEELLGAGADPNAVYGKNTSAYDEGKSALMRVIENMGDEILARRLLEHGADPLFTCGVKEDGTPANDYTVLRSCYITASETVGAGTYARKTEDVHAMLTDVPMVGLSFVRDLLERGVDANLQNHRGGPLHYAASLDLPDHVLCLLEAGADPQSSFQARGVGEMTVLHMARGYETTRLLLEWGANPYVRDGGGLNPAESANKHGGRDQKLRALQEWSEDFSPVFTVEAGDKKKKNRHLVRLETKPMDKRGRALTRAELKQAITEALERLTFPADPPEESEDETV